MLHENGIKQMQGSVVKSSHLEWLIGAMSAFLLLVGRWSPTRLFNQERVEISIFEEPRFWITLILLAIFLLPIRKRSNALRVRRVGTAAPIMITLSLFIGYSLLSALWAVDAALALEKAYELVLIWIAIITIFKWSTLGDGDHIRRVFWNTLLITGSVLALFAIISILTSTSSASTSRIAVLAGGPNAFGRMMGLLCIGALWKSTKTHYWFIWLPIAVTSFLLVVLTGSRGALIALVAGLVTYLLIGKIRITRLVGLGGLAAFLVVILLWFTPIGQPVQNIFELRIGDLLLEQGYISGRTTIYADALALGEENVMFGAGLASFQALSDGTYPHNLILEAFSEGGVMALVFLLASILLVARHVLKYRNSLDIATVSSLVLAFIFSQASGDLYDSRVVFFLMILTIPVTVAAGAIAETKVARPIAALSIKKPST